VLLLREVTRNGVIYTTVIRGFTECWPIYRVSFVSHSAKMALPRAALGKVRISANSLFTECWTLGKGGARQRAVSGRPKVDGCQSLPRANGWHSVNSLLCRVPPSWHSTKSSLPSVISRHSAKYIFIFFILSPKLFVVCSYTM
jgi:hypothetical protein